MCSSDLLLLLSDTNKTSIGTSFSEGGESSDLGVGFCDLLRDSLGCWAAVWENGSLLELLDRFKICLCGFSLLGLIGLAGEQHKLGAVGLQSLYICLK